MNKQSYKEIGIIFNLIATTLNLEKRPKVKGNTCIRSGNTIETFNNKSKFYGHATKYSNQTAICAQS